MPTPKKAAAPKNALSKPVQPDAALTAVVGKDPLPRTELTKKLWEYIRKHELQDPKNKRNIRTDEKLLVVFEIDDLLQPEIYLVALGEQFIEFRLSEYAAQRAAQRCLRNERSRFQVVLHSHDRRRWIDDAKINNGVNGHRHVVPRHDFLASDVDGHDAQMHPHHAI